MSNRHLNALIHQIVGWKFRCMVCAERDVVQRCYRRCAGMLKGHGYCCLSIQCNATCFFPQRSQYTSNIRKVYADQIEGMHGASRLPDCSGVPLFPQDMTPFCHTLVSPFLVTLLSSDIPSLKAMSLS